MSITWGVELKDGVSQPAGMIASAMGTAAQQTKVLTSAMTAAQNAVTKAAAIGDVKGAQAAASRFHALSMTLADLPPHEHEASDGAKGLGDSMFASVFKAELLSHAVEELGRKAAEALKEGFMYAIDASENLKRMTAQFDALGPSGQHAGKQTVAAIRDIAKEVPQSEAQVASWARSLMATGTIKLDKLKDQIKAIAGADALGAVEGAGDATRSILAKLNEQGMAGGGKVKFSMAQLAPTGISEPEFLKALGMTPQNFAAAKKAGTLTGAKISDAIVKAINIKAGGALGAQMDELSTIVTKAKDGFMHLFEDVDPAPLIDGLKEFFSIFDLANPSGQVIKATIVTVFNALYKITGKVFEAMRVGFLHLIIWGLQAALFVKQHFGAIKAALIGVGVALLVVFGPAALAALAAFTMAMWGAAVATIAANLPLLLIAAAIGLVTAAVIYFWPQIKKAVSAVVEFAEKGWDAASNFVSGFVNGIVGGIVRAEQAVANMGTAVLDKVRGLFKSHSPSQVMFEIGAGIPEGMAGGIRGGTGAAVGASADMSGDVMGAAASGRGGRGGAGGGVVIHIDQFTIEAGHAASPGELRHIVEEEFTSLAERLAAMIGAAPQPA